MSVSLRIDSIRLRGRCVAVCCSVLQFVAVCCSGLQCVAVCCSMLQCVAVCCSMLQCVAVCCGVLLCVAVSCSVLQYVAVSCSVLQCVAACCSVLQGPPNPIHYFFFGASSHITFREKKVFTHCSIQKYLNLAVQQKNMYIHIYICI